MKAENAGFDDGSKWEEVEKGGKILPNFGISILSKALVIESVYLSDLLGLVITTQNGDSLRVSDLHGHEQRNGLDGIVASINVVTHEQVVVIWDLPTNLKELLEVMELPMDVTTYGNWSSNIHHITFIFEDFLRFFTKCFDIVLRKWRTCSKLFNRLVQLLSILEIDLF